mmetsp:Transcript_21340/g.39040  ORF Transcript_21340/g.39040 Transcript_21340/m.39040 type:complete len:228 (+) Transcript_21340:222-905(+)
MQYVLRVHKIFLWNYNCSTVLICPMVEHRLDIDILSQEELPGVCLHKAQSEVWPGGQVNSPPVHLPVPSHPCMADLESMLQDASHAGLISAMKTKPDSRFPSQPLCLLSEPLCESRLGQWNLDYFHTRDLLEIVQTDPAVRNACAQHAIVLSLSCPKLGIKGICGLAITTSIYCMCARVAQAFCACTTISSTFTAPQGCKAITAAQLQFLHLASRSLCHSVEPSGCI